MVDDCQYVQDISSPMVEDAVGKAVEIGFPDVAVDNLEA